MATKMRIEFNYKAFDVIRKSKGVQADLKERADRIAEAAGPGVEVTTTLGAHRARASVMTMTYDAMESEAKDKTLSRAIEAGR